VPRLNAGNDDDDIPSLSIMPHGGPLFLPTLVGGRGGGSGAVCPPTAHAGGAGIEQGKGFAFRSHCREKKLELVGLALSPFNVFNPIKAEVERCHKIEALLRNPTGTGRSGWANWFAGQEVIVIYIYW
jgi:hypothetical protein